MVQAREMRARLVEEAIRLVDEHGADGLHVRRLAAAVGTSTMAVYTHFSGMPGLLCEVRAEGFRRLATALGAIPRTADPVADLVTEALTYRQVALDGPHVFALAFSAAAPDLREPGRAAFELLRGLVGRAIDAGRFPRVDAGSAAAQLWAAHHGVVMLELSGILPAAPRSAVDTVVVPQTVHLAIGFGDDPAAAHRSAEVGAANWQRMRAGDGARALTPGA
ncbi:transcriptional regulator, TetR family [Pseudonocardia thermophila]|jgi:Transcriptional regulator|uniref:Transcriptional regulator, TetR family n=1 Tax=Pseudonocardia thermophila TaxID=1848 RepID=A0A1M6NSP2_PSETH|nr:TetR/AcrR family transcriptional regulator [Pseudonocardia thermophila]SHJ98592.1 transcriptional regulator, TetR family [Pseudonocardia thermophila]